MGETGLVWYPRGGSRPNNNRHDKEVVHINSEEGMTEHNIPREPLGYLCTRDKANLETTMQEVLRE